MEWEKKRKRVEKGEIEGGGGRRKNEREAEEERVEAGAVPSPTEEEVEEFFAIIRRMYVAVKYFEKGNGKLTERQGTASETQVLERIDDGKVGEESVDGELDNGVLDLNVIPEGESNTD